MNRAPVPGRRPASLAWLVAVLTGAVVLVAACSTAPPSATRTPGADATGPSASLGGAGTIQPPTSFGPPPSPTPPDDTEPLTIDSALLSYLPESVEGVPVTEDANEAAIALGNRSLDDLATALDAAVAVDGAGNLVYALVVQLKPDALSDEGFRQWRDSYDEGVCATSGGIVGRAQAEIGGRDAYVTSCVGGILSYHVLLEEQNVLISAWALGDGRFGEKLLAGLRVPE